VARKPEKLAIVDERAAFEAEIARDHGFHLIEEQLLRDAAEEDERVFEAVDQCGHVLTRVEPAPEQPRVAEDDQQRIADAPRKPKPREVHLRLSSRRRLEADDGLRRRRRPYPSHERFQLRVPTDVPGGPNLVEQPHRRQLGIHREAGFNDRLVGIELRRHRRARPVLHWRRIEITIQIAIANPPVNRVAADAQLARQRTLAGAVIEVVPE
jgi:hypothetical protein